MTPISLNTTLSLTLADDFDFSNPSTPANLDKNELNEPPFCTPVKLRDTVDSISDEDLTFSSPDRYGREMVDQGLKEMHELENSNKKRIAAEILTTVLDQLVPDFLLECDHFSPEFHEAASTRLQQVGLSRTGRKIISSAARALDQSPYRVVSTRHLTTLDETGGYHLHSPNSGIKVEVIETNPKTGIKFVRVDDKKLSTLYPEGTKKSEVIEWANNSEKIAQEHNRSLRMTPLGYPIEVYTRDNILIPSVFPVFFFDEFEASKTYEITASFKISSEEALAAAREPMATMTYSFWNSEDKRLDGAIIDLSPVFENSTGVTKGILMKFNRSNTTDLLDYYS